MHRIKIVEYTQSGSLAFDLKDLLTTLADWGSGLGWSVFSLRAAGEDIVRLEAISDSPSGIVLSWRELLVLSGQVTQTYDGVFVGCVPGGTPPTQKRDREMEIPDACELVIEAVDSTYWVVAAAAPGAIQALQARFSHTEPYETTSR